MNSPESPPSSAPPTPPQPPVHTKNPPPGTPFLKSLFLACLMACGIGFVLLAIAFAVCGRVL